MRSLTILWSIALIMNYAAAQNPTIQELLNQVGIPPQGDQRGQMDTVGFASRAEQMDAVMAQCQSLALPRQQELAEKHHGAEKTAFTGGICPHDDYIYAGRLYSLLLSHVKAKTVIIFGVFHKARVFNVQDKLIFDAYRIWYAPYGPVRVSPLREQILERLPAEDYLVDNDMQMVEHSVEAIVPFLQAYNQEVEIVSILVPYMHWEVMERLAEDLSGALLAIITEQGLRLGEDLALICSADAVHYGDSGWGGYNYAPFGADVLGYQRAVQQDLNLAENYLSGELHRDKLKSFFYECVNPEDITQYRITWCGRFSVPFGLNVLSRLLESSRLPPAQGVLLDYGDSVSEASLEIEGLGGLGVTAPNNFHHFVGYAAVGYLAKSE
ncbi:MAG: AmmeMemoRadiSam system protein B [bacterium]